MKRRALHASPQPAARGRVAHTLTAPSGKLVACPICNAPVPLADINTHVDGCVPAPGPVPAPAPSPHTSEPSQSDPTRAVDVVDDSTDSEGEAADAAAGADIGSARDGSPRSTHAHPAPNCIYLVLLHHPCARPGAERTARQPTPVCAPSAVPGPVASSGTPDEPTRDAASCTDIKGSHFKPSGPPTPSRNPSAADCVCGLCLCVRVCVR